MKLPHLIFEEEIWSEGGLVCGVDEVGRGCLAGPVVAAAVVLPLRHKPIKNVRDSKKLTAKMRQGLSETILESCADFGLGLVPALDIDKLGIAVASKRAMAEAVNQLSLEPDLLLVDAFEIDEILIAQKPIIKGDEICYSIACASIIAKVYRDSIVSGMDHDFPNHGFSKHKGYGTKLHFDAIKKHGVTPEHRKTFLGKTI